MCLLCVFPTKDIQFFRISQVEVPALTHANANVAEKINVQVARGAKTCPSAHPHRPTQRAFLCVLEHANPLSDSEQGRKQRAQQGGTHGNTLCVCFVYLPPGIFISFAFPKLKPQLSPLPMSVRVRRLAFQVGEHIVSGD